jgi:hypothetical protein
MPRTDHHHFDDDALHDLVRVIAAWLVADYEAECRAMDMEQGRTTTTTGHVPCRAPAPDTDDNGTSTRT